MICMKGLRQCFDSDANHVSPVRTCHAFLDSRGPIFVALGPWTHLIMLVSTLHHKVCTSKSETFSLPPLLTIFLLLLLIILIILA